MILLLFRLKKRIFLLRSFKEESFFLIIFYQGFLRSNKEKAHTLCGLFILLLKSEKFGFFE